MNNVAGGQIAVSNAAVLSLEGMGTFNNNGNIALNSTGSNTDLTLVDGGTVTLSGAGTVTMGNNANNRIYSTGVATALVIGSSQSVQGAGQTGRYPDDPDSRRQWQNNHRPWKHIGQSGFTYTQTDTNTTTNVNGTLKAALVDIKGGMLEGSGTVTGNLTEEGGQLNPGNSPETFNGSLDGHRCNGTFDDVRSGVRPRGAAGRVEAAIH